MLYMLCIHVPSSFRISPFSISCPAIIHIHIHRSELDRADDREIWPPLPPPLPSPTVWFSHSRERARLSFCTQSQWRWRRRRLLLAAATALATKMALVAAFKRVF